MSTIIIKYNIKMCPCTTECNSGKILVEMTNGVLNAFFIEEGANNEEKKEMKGDVKVYDENKSSQESMHDEAINISKLMINCRVKL